MPESLKNEKGLAFILVVWVLVLLIALGTEFAFSMRTEVNTTRNYKEDRETYFLAKAGIQLAMAELLQKASFHSTTPEKGYIIGKPATSAKDQEEAQPTSIFSQKTEDSNSEETEEEIYESVREDISSHLITEHRDIPHDTETLIEDKQSPREVNPRGP